MTKNNKIVRLPKRVFEKIAAGEVVTGPLSVVKELVENAIDAGAASISVEIREGGKSYIRIVDDGSGIRAEDIELAFQPHATGKISDETDLDHIETLGFRGEALSSIAAVSRMEMITKTGDAKMASAVSAEGGRISGVKGTGAADGTTVIVRDLYFNTPARLKFMKSDRAESAAVIDFMSKIAVAYPHIRVKTVNNDAILFSTNGKGDAAQAILTVYGADNGADLIAVEAEAEQMSLRALISGPNKSRKSRRGQILFVNGRWVTDEHIASAIAEAYREYLFEGRFPIVYLFLRVDPARIDVNVHPAKSEIRFYEGHAVRDFVRDAIRSGLASKEGIPGLPTGRRWTKKEIWDSHQKEAAFYSLKEGAETAPGEETASAIGGGTAGSASKGAVRDGDGDYVETINIRKLWETKIAGEPPHAAYDAEEPAREEAAAPRADGVSTQEALDIASLSVLGCVFATYLLASDSDSLYIVDQHAAHERVNYERFLAQSKSAERLTQQILSPLVCRLPLAAKSAADDWAAWLTGWGFEADLFGENAVIVKTFPAFLPYAEAERFLMDIVDNASDAPPDNEKALERLISRACKQSVKANDALRDDEIAALLDDLARCENPYTCPHGRPVFIRMSRSDLERLFKRV